MEIDQLTNDLSTALDKVIKKRRRSQMFAILAGIVGVVVAIGIIVTRPSGDWLRALLPLILAYFFYRYMAKSFAKSLSLFTLPILCEMAGGYRFAVDVPPELTRRMVEFGVLPNAGRAYDWNLISGAIGDAQFQSWICRIEITRKDREKLLFAGTVLQMPAISPGDDILVRLARAQGFGNHKQADSTATRIRIEDDEGTEYNIFPGPAARQKPTQDWIQTRISRTNAMLDDDAQVFGYLENEAGRYLVISDTSPPFHVDGLFADKATLLGEMHRAMGELALPAKLMDIWQRE
ncbi:MAG: hypothetical protein WBC93_21165 [Sulfitobacter sp.]